MSKASIITIGDELLIGQVIDTNSAWMAQELNKHGIAVGRRVAVGDAWDEIWRALDEESAAADIILITGGLGPTSDDITKPLLCKYFAGNMVTNEAALANVKYLFAEVFKREITPRNILQGEVPDVCTVLQNSVGTAPGMVFTKGEKIFVSMPGVPFEMQQMMATDVIPMLKQKFDFPHIAHKTLLTFGVGESFIADILAAFESNLPTHIKLAYLPNYGMVRLRLSSTGKEMQTTNDEIDRYFETLQNLVEPYLVVTEDIRMQNVVAQLLQKHQRTLCTAESCTGGYISHLITAIPGSSLFYDGSVISYSYKAKEDLLQVKKQTLEMFGAVSEEVVKEMAAGALQNIHSNYTIAVSGIMGPDGGMEGKPVGTVWVAVGNNKKLETKKFRFRFARQRNIELTAVNALNMLREFILAHEEAS